MAMEDGMEEVVSILTNYYSGNHQFLVEQYGDQAVSLAGDMGQMLEEMFTNETPFSQLWLEYKEDPASNETEILGSLEMLEESLPNVTIRLEGYYAAFQELNQDGVVDLVETSEPEDTISIEEIQAVKSMDDMDNDDEYKSPNQALLGGLYILVLQQLENHILVPNVMRSQTDISPLLIIIAIFLGSSLGGLVGIPLAAILRILVKYVIAPAVRSRIKRCRAGRSAPAQ